MAKKWSFVVFVLLLGMLALAACATLPPPPAAPAVPDTAVLQARVKELEAQVQALQAIAGPPPAALDAFYPPTAKAPLWTLGMLEMDNALNSAISDVAQGDLPGAAANWNHFTQKYMEMSQMVPEWNGYFKTDFLDTGAQALKNGDVPGFFANMGALGAVCGGCHMVNQANVQYRYDWPSFGQITVPLPPKQEQKSWSDMMQALAMTMAGVGNDLQQGQLDNARRNFQAFSATFDVLSEACSNCHDTPRAYFVDDRVRGDIEALGAALQADAPDGKAVGGLLAKIGGESCGACHRVHEPAALVKERWSRVGQ